MKTIRLRVCSAAGITGVLVVGTPAVSADIDADSMKELRRALDAYCQSSEHGYYQQTPSTFVSVDPEPAVSVQIGLVSDRFKQSHTRYPKQPSYSDTVSPVVTGPPSLLPAGFRDDFTAPWFVRERSAAYFKDTFAAKLRTLGLYNQDERTYPYQRAEMRRWHLYESCEFRDFLQ